MRDTRRSGSGVAEASYYPILWKLLDEVGATLKPKVKCILQVSHGAGIPDGGFFTPDQFQQGPEPLPGTVPPAASSKPPTANPFLTPLTPTRTSL